MNRTVLGVVCAAAIGLLGCGGGAPSEPVASQPAASPAASAQQPASVTPVAVLPQDISGVLDSYRKIIVLVEDSRTLADQRRADVAGRLLYQQKHEQLSALLRDLAGDLRAQPARLDRLSAFLDVLERHPDLRDADKLAFRDVVEELADTMDGSRLTDAARSIRGRLQEDATVLAEIQRLYSKELEKIFGRFDTRGMQVRRDAWETYLDFLRTRYSAGAILVQHAVDASATCSCTRMAATPRRCVRGCRS